MAPRSTRKRTVELAFPKTEVCVIFLARLFRLPSWWIFDRDRPHFLFGSRGIQYTFVQQTDVAWFTVNKRQDSARKSAKRLPLSYIIIIIIIAHNKGHLSPRGKTRWQKATAHEGAPFTSSLVSGKEKGNPSFWCGGFIKSSLERNFPCRS